MGAVFIIGSLSGKLVLMCTQSGTALAVFGAVLGVWGAMQTKCRGV